MDYTFKMNEGLKFDISTSNNMQFGVTAGNTGNYIMPDGVVTSSSIKHIEAVTKQWYNTNQREKNTVYIITDEE